MHQLSDLAGACWKGEDGPLASLERVYRELGLAQSRAAIRQQLKSLGGFVNIVEELRERASGTLKDEKTPTPTLIIPFDQGEELLVGEGEIEAEALFDLVRHQAELEFDIEKIDRTPFIFVIAIRSDSYHKLQNEKALGALNRRIFGLCMANS